jgi:hypothetical protein
LTFQKNRKHFNVSIDFTFFFHFLVWSFVAKMNHESRWSREMKNWNADLRQWQGLRLVIRAVIVDCRVFCVTPTNIQPCQPPQKKSIKTFLHVSRALLAKIPKHERSMSNFLSCVLCLRAGGANIKGRREWIMMRFNWIQLNCEKCFFCFLAFSLRLATLASCCCEGIQELCVHKELKWFVDMFCVTRNEIIELYTSASHAWLIISLLESFGETIWITEFRWRHKTGFEFILKAGRAWQMTSRHWLIKSENKLITGEARLTTGSFPHAPVLWRNFTTLPTHSTRRVSIFVVAWRGWSSLLSCDVLLLLHSTLYVHD